MNGVAVSESWAADEQSATGVVRYEADEHVARITLNRPHHGNSITSQMAGELARFVERANLDPAIHVIALAGEGAGFCAGYDLDDSMQTLRGGGCGATPASARSPLDGETIAANHDPGRPWDPIVDYQMMSRNAAGLRSMFDSEKPVVCKVHGFCVAGGADLALSADLIVIEDEAKFGHPPARAWGIPTSGLWASRVGAMRAKRLLFTGDCLSGREAVEWGFAIESAPLARLEERFETLLQRIALVPVNQLVMQKLLINHQVEAQGMPTSQLLGVIFDGIARHTPEGHAFASVAQSEGWRAAVRSRDGPFGDLGRSTFKG